MSLSWFHQPHHSILQSFHHFSAAFSLKVDSAIDWLVKKTYDGKSFCFWQRRVRCVMHDSKHQQPKSPRKWRWYMLNQGRRHPLSDKLSALWSFLEETLNIFIPSFSKEQRGQPLASCSSEGNAIPAQRLGYSNQFDLVCRSSTAVNVLHFDSHRRALHSSGNCS